jgi:hypothetical protein
MFFYLVEQIKNELTHSNQALDTIKMEIKKKENADRNNLKVSKVRASQMGTIE